MKVKKLVSILVICVLTAAICCGCTKVSKDVSLEKAYENGYITQEQLKSIAYYYNNKSNMEYPEPDFELIPKKKLSKSTVNKLKRAYLKKNVKDDHPLATINCITTYEYYGTYNDYAVVFMLDNKRYYSLRIEPEKTIGGVTFYNYCSPYVYHIG